MNTEEMFVLRCPDCKGTGDGEYTDPQIGDFGVAPPCETCNSCGVVFAYGVEEQLEQAMPPHARDLCQRRRNWQRYIAAINASYATADEAAAGISKAVKALQGA